RRRGRIIFLHRQLGHERSVLGRVLVCRNERVEALGGGGLGGVGAAVHNGGIDGVVQRVGKPAARVAARGEVAYQRRRGTVVDAAAAGQQHHAAKQRENVGARLPPRKRSIALDVQPKTLARERFRPYAPLVGTMGEPGG